jgi:ankyrin repeat protein
MGGNKQIVEFLLQKQADVNAEAPNGTTPLNAVVTTGKVQVLALLLKHGAGRTCARHLDSALADALDHGNAQTIAMLQAAKTRQRTIW